MVVETEKHAWRLAVMVLLLCTLALSLIVLTRPDTCTEARDLCYKGCDDSWTSELASGLCKEVQCNGAYEKCELARGG